MPTITDKNFIGCGLHSYFFSFTTFILVYSSLTISEVYKNKLSLNLEQQGVCKNTFLGLTLA
ncbi:MAG: hypothetical protein Phog2KO_43770 [Phototrophicaceae bacterium]